MGFGMSHNDYTDHEIRMVMDTLDCTREHAIAALDDAINLDERLAVIGLAHEQGGDIVRSSGWREAL
jgi:hypothetical protein